CSGERPRRVPQATDRRALDLRLHQLPRETLRVGLQPLDRLNRLFRIDLERLDYPRVGVSQILRPLNGAGTRQRLDAALTRCDAAFADDDKEPDVASGGHVRP